MAYVPTPSDLARSARAGRIAWTEDYGWRPTPAGEAWLAVEMSKLPARIAICDVMIAHEDLTIEGFDNPARPQFEKAGADLLWGATDQFERAVAWLRTVRHTKTPTLPSYWLKHQVQRLTGGYVSNGALIAAAIHLGIRVRRSGGFSCDLAVGGRRNWQK